jgi:hypothetical protein
LQHLSSFFSFIQPFVSVYIFFIYQGKMRFDTIAAVSVLSLLASQAGAVPQDTLREQRIREYEQHVMSALAAGGGNLFRNQSIEDNYATQEAGTSETLTSPPEIFFNYAAAAYCTTSSDLTAWGCGRYCDAAPPTKVIGVLRSSTVGTEGYIALREDVKQIVVVFKGSSKWEDWIKTNINLSTTKFDGVPGVPEDAMVHSGFLTSIRSVLPEMLGILKDMIKEFPDYQVVFTGHSLGGALAILGAVHVEGLLLRDQAQSTAKSPQLQVYTFGQPRVGNSVLSRHIRSLNIPIHRFVNKNDLVPQIPPVYFTYSHHKREHWITQEERVVECQDEDITEDPNCSISVSPYSWSILDHNNYFGIWINFFACKAP